MEPGGVINQEAGATLEEVLAFIDAWDGDGPARSLDQAAQVKVVTSKSRGGHEVKRLRREAKYLELRLQQLNSCGSNETVGMLKTDAGRVQWTGAELSEYRRYQKATRTNQQLKALVAKRDQEIALLLNSQRLMIAQNSAMEDSLAIDSLINRLRSLEMDLDDVMARAGLAHADSLANRLLCKVDLDMAVVSERSSCYPVGCSLEQADSYLSIRFRQRAAAIKEANGIARFTKISYFEQARQGYELRTKTIMRTIEQSDRLIYLQSSMTSLASERLNFDEDYIIIVRRPPSSSCVAFAPPSESLLLSWHRIRGQHHGEATTPRSGRSLKQLVMDSVIDRQEAHMRNLKNQIQGSSLETPSST